MHYYLYYDRQEVSYYLECPGVERKFGSSNSLFEWLKNHLEPGDSLHWVDAP